MSSIQVPAPTNITTSLPACAAALITGLTQAQSDIIALEGGSDPGVDTVHQVRGVVYANVASLASFTVAGNDGITYVAGDLVLLAAQSTAAKNGIYVVGTVTTGTAPLTRPTNWATGGAIPLASMVEVGGEGTIFGGSSWKAMCGKGKVIDTDDPTFYPRMCKASVTLSSGTYALGSTEGLFLFSATSSSVQATRRTVGGTITTTIMYACPTAASARVAGVSGTAVVTVNAETSSGSTLSTDQSVVDVLVQNW